jgi:hypothetical protein
VGYASPEFAAALAGARAEQTVIDLARIGGREALAAAYDGICW